MKLGIKKIHENEWLVHVGCGSIRMDRFSVELLNVTLEHLVALERGKAHSVLTSYIRMGAKMKDLNEAGIQLLVRSVDNQDLLKLILIANDDEMANVILGNVGGILAKQLRDDMGRSVVPEEEDAKAAIKRIVETMYELEAQGKIEFFGATTQYI